MRKDGKGEGGKSPPSLRRLIHDCFRIVSRTPHYRISRSRREITHVVPVLRVSPSSRATTCPHLLVRRDVIGFFRKHVAVPLLPRSEEDKCPKMNSNGASRIISPSHARTAQRGWGKGRRDEERLADGGKHAGDVGGNATPRENVGKVRGSLTREDVGLTPCPSAPALSTCSSCCAVTVARGTTNVSLTRAVHSRRERYRQARR